MAGHYYYDPRPYYGLNMNTNLMPLDELFYKTSEPVPYWMDQRMAPMAYPDYVHSGSQCVEHEVMTRSGPEMMLPSYNAARDDIFADTYNRSPHFISEFGVKYPEMWHPLRGQSQDDTYLDHTMTTPQYVNFQNQFPHQGVGYDAIPVPMGHLSSTKLNNGNSKQQQQQQLYMNRDLSSESDEEYECKTGKKWGTKTLFKHSKGDTYSHSKGYGNEMGSKSKQLSQFYSQLKSVELEVPICCDKCERKVMACLEYVAGVESVLCDQWQKKVIVYGDVKPHVVLKRVRRVKKASSLLRSNTVYFAK